MVSPTLTTCHRAPGPSLQALRSAMPLPPGTCQAGSPRRAGAGRNQRAGPGRTGWRGALRELRKAAEPLDLPLFYKTLRSAVTPCAPRPWGAGGAGGGLLPSSPGAGRPCRRRPREPQEPAGGRPRHGPAPAGRRLSRGTRGWGARGATEVGQVPRSGEGSPGPPTPGPAGPRALGPRRSQEQSRAAAPRPVPQGPRVPGPRDPAGLGVTPRRRLRGEQVPARPPAVPAPRPRPLASRGRNCGAPAAPRPPLRAPQTRGDGEGGRGTGREHGAPDAICLHPAEARPPAPPARSPPTAARPAAPPGPEEAPWGAGPSRPRGPGRRPPRAHTRAAAPHALPHAPRQLAAAARAAAETPRPAPEVPPPRCPGPGSRAARPWRTRRLRRARGRFWGRECKQIGVL